MRPALAAAPTDVPLGLYLHIPFCRKRCHFCYFRVYTDKNAAEVQGYLDTLAREWELYSEQRAVAGRPLNFVYFGGGTPSFLSVRQTAGPRQTHGCREPVASRRRDHLRVRAGHALGIQATALRDIGVTRLSLGVENFDDRLLEINGRAHRSPEIGKAYSFAQSLGFPQINIDLIAGMLGETDENWRDCVQRTIALAPDSVTIYQMELPFNTTIAKSLRAGEAYDGEAVASWSAKRRWVDEAFDAFEAAGYTVASAYAVVKDPSTKFVYRDRLWQGADMVGLGVASFGHISGVHMQNLDTFGPYCESLTRGELPLGRGLRPTPEERLIREFVLQLKLGAVRPSYFANKYGVDVLERFDKPLRSLASQRLLTATRELVTLSREGLLRVDSLLPTFFLPAHAKLRYT